MAVEGRRPYSCPHGRRYGKLNGKPRTHLSLHKNVPCIKFLEYNPQFKFSAEQEGRVSPYHDEWVIKDHLSCKC